MSSTCSIIVADDDPLCLEQFSQVLVRSGHSVIRSSLSGDELRNLCLSEQPDLAVIDIGLDPDDGLAAVGRVLETIDLPIIVLTERHGDDTLQRAISLNTFAFLFKPFVPDQLDAAVQLAMARFGETVERKSRITELSQALEDRKTIEKAKGVLMRVKNLSEPESHKELQRIARDHQQRMSDVAAKIVFVDEAM